MRRKRKKRKERKKWQPSVVHARQFVNRHDNCFGFRYKLVWHEAQDHCAIQILIEPLFLCPFASEWLRRGVSFSEFEKTLPVYWLWPSWYQCTSSIFVTVWDSLLLSLSWGQRPCETCGSAVMCPLRLYSHCLYNVLHAIWDCWPFWRSSCCSLLSLEWGWP